MLNTILVGDRDNFYLLYSSAGFIEGLIVTGYFIYPDFTKTETFTFLELGDGVYGAKGLSLPATGRSSTTVDIMEKYGLVMKEDGVTKILEIFSFSHKRAEI